MRGIDIKLSQHENTDTKLDRSLGSMPKVTRAALMPYLLHARAEAVYALRQYLSEIDNSKQGKSKAGSSVGRATEVEDALSLLKNVRPSWRLD